MFALHMFDAPVGCRATAVFNTASGESRSQTMAPPFLHSRVTCDPIVYFHLARHYCRQNAAVPTLSSVDVTLETRLQGHPRFHTIMAVEDFCVSNPSYDVWRHNAWIQPWRDDGSAFAVRVARLSRFLRRH